MNIKNGNKTKKCAAGSGQSASSTGSGTGSQHVPDATLNVPDSNVGADGQCIVPPHPESVRQNTGEPCDDGRDGGR